MIDDIMLSEQAKETWIMRMRDIAQSGVLKGLKEEDIPDEDTRLDENGDLEIFIKIPNVIEIKMKVTKEHWKYKS